jgi:hypothetical protein
MNIINLDDLEVMTQNLYGPKQDPSISEYAKQLTEYYVSNYSFFPQLFDFFIKTNNQHCQFWLLDLLIHLVNSCYSGFQPDDKAKFREYLINLFQNHITKIQTATFISNKYGLLFINWLKHDYPENWPELVKDLVQLIFSTTDENLKMQKVVMFIDFLLIFDDELIKFRHTYTEFEINRSTLIKDYLRLHGINDIVFMLGQLILGHQVISKKITINAIKVIAELIDWNVLTLFSDIVQYVCSDLIKINDFQSECLDVLNAIVEKGMEPLQKLEIIKFLNLNSLINEIFKNNPQMISENSLFHICEIVSNMGNMTIECFNMFNKFKKENPEGQGLTDEQQAMFNYICEIANYCLFHSVTIISYSTKIEHKIALHLLDFISSITAFFKQNVYLSEILLEQLKNLTKTIGYYLIIPVSDYDIKSNVFALANHEDDSFFIFRKEFSVIYQNLSSLPLIKSDVIVFIEEIFKKISNNQSDVYEMELALYLMNVIQNQMNNPNQHSGSFDTQHISKLMTYLFSIPFIESDSDYVLLLFYETVSKFMQYVIANESVLLYMIQIYLGKKGISYNDIKIGPKICHFFDKFLDKVKTNLGKNLELTNSIEIGLNNLINALIELKNFQILVEYTVLFHSLSFVIIHRYYLDHKKPDTFQAFFNLIHKTFKVFGNDAEKFNEITKFLTNFLKCFNQELHANTKETFILFFNEYIREYYLKVSQFPKCKYSIITVLQRLILILGNESLQYVEYFILEDLQVPSEELYEDAIKLLQNATQLLKKDSKPLVVKAFSNFYFALKKWNLPSSNISDVDKNIIYIYANFAKLLANITTDIVEVLFEGSGLNNCTTEELVNYMIYVGQEIIDPNTRRSLIKSLKAIVVYLIKVLTTSNLDETISKMGINYIQNILTGVIQMFAKLKMTDPTDYNVRYILTILEYS